MSYFDPNGLRIGPRAVVTPFPERCPGPRGLHRAGGR